MPDHRDARAAWSGPEDARTDHIMRQEILTPREARIRREIAADFAECSRLGSKLDAIRTTRYERDEEPTDADEARRRP